MPELILKLGETVVQTYAFDKDAVNIGRSKDNDIVIETLSVSRNHARLRREGARYWVHDLESANGTHVNGVRMSKSQLADGDEIGIGKHRIVFSDKALTEDELITVAYDADRTMLMDPAPVGVLVVLQGKQKNQEFLIDRYETIIGRGENCAVRLFDWFVSKRHAMIRREGKKFVISDFGKLTGVQVNGHTIREPHDLMDGDDVKIGPVSLKFMIRVEPSVVASVDQNRPAEVEPVPVQSLKEEFEDEQEMVALSSRLEDDAESPSEEVTPEAEELVKVIDSTPIPDMEAFLTSDEVGEAGDAQDEQPEWMSDVLSQQDESLEKIELSGNGNGAESKPSETEASVEVVESPVCAEEVPPEVKIWQKALTNPSAAIRREAARKLKKLTGKDYDV